MPSGQTSINSSGQPYGVAGQMSDNASVVDKVSGFSEEASASIPFGVAVAQGVAAQGIKNLSASGNAIKGIHATNFEHAPGLFGDIDSSNVGLVPNGRADVLRKGRIWVVLDGNLTIAPFSDRCFVRYSLNSLGPLGAFSNVTDSGKNTDITRIAQFVSLAQLSADGVTYIAQVDVDFTISPIAENSGD